MPYSEETTNDLIINLMLNTPYNPETAELNQLYLTPDTTDQDIADAISEHNTSNTAHADIRTIAAKGETAYNTIQNYGNIVTHNVSEFATSVQGGLADTAVQPADLTPITNDITAIEDLIPSQATTSNQLADKSFVNSSISTNTANFIGTFNSVADLEAYSGTLTNNDYAFVVGTDADGNTVYNRYKYTTATTPASWVFEYALNNSSFTSDQWAAINSGVTENDVSLAQSAVQPSDLANVATTGDYDDLIDKPTIPTINSTNNYVPYRSSASAFSNSTLMYNSSAMAATGKLHVGSSSPASYADKGRFTIYDNTAGQQTTSMALLNYGGGGGCGVAIDMYNTSANGGIPSGKFGLVDNGNYSGYLQLKVKKSGAASNPLLPAMNIVPVPATSSLTTCISFGQDEFNRVLFDLHKPEATVTITDSDKRWGGSGTTYSVTGSNKFNPRLLVAVGDIVSFDNFTTEATVTGVVSNSSTCQITVNTTLGTISNKNISVKKAYFKITDESNNIKVYVDPYGKFGIGTGTPAYDLDVAGTINASTDVKRNGQSLSTVTFYWGE